MLKIIGVCLFAIFAAGYMFFKLSDYVRWQRICCAVVVGILAFAIGFWITPNSSSDSSNSSNRLKDENGREYAQCSSCDTKYYSDAFDNEDYKSIRNSGMCKRCLKNYKEIKDAYDHYNLNN